MQYCFHITKRMARGQHETFVILYELHVFTYFYAKYSMDNPFLFAETISMASIKSL